MKEYEKIDEKEWQRIESEEHDKQYEMSTPFCFDTYRIEASKVLYWEDFCFKKNRRNDRGHRTKYLLDCLNVNQLKDKKILDIGCGNGQYSVLLALLGASVSGIDISPIGIKIAKDMASINGVCQLCDFSVQNASCMDFPDETFDIILLHEVLHHAIKYSGVKEEIYRVLKKDGIVACSESLYGNPFFKFARSFTMRGKEEKGDVALRLSDLEDFAKDYRESKIEPMSLLFMSRRFFRNIVGYAPIRSLLLLLKITDDYLFRILPRLKRFCGEAVLIAIK